MEAIRRSWNGGPRDLPDDEPSTRRPLDRRGSNALSSSLHGNDVELTSLGDADDMKIEKNARRIEYLGDEAEVCSSELDPILHNGTSSTARGDNLNPHGAPITPGSSNKLQVATNIIVSFVGAGLLGVPNAFAQAGWLLGSVALCVVSALNVYAMLLLPQVQRAVLAKQQLTQSKPQSSLSPTTTQLPCQSYGDLGRCILGPHGETLVNVSLGISQAGFATAYIIFIAANLNATWHLPRGPLLANLSNFCALSAVLLQDYESYEPRMATQSVKWGGLMYVIAITIYSMEGVGLILSLESSAKDRAGFNSLFKLMLSGITMFMAFFGTAGCLAFGDDTKAPITLNLGNDWTATFVKCALCLGLYLTYPIMMFPIWSIIERLYPITKHDPRIRISFRCSLVLLSAFVAYSIPDFGKFLSLVGSSICTLLGFILPCYFHMAVLGHELLPWQRFLDYFLMAGGALFGIMGTWSSCRAMVSGELDGH